MEQISLAPDASDQSDPALDRRELIAHHMAALEELVDPHDRSAGWTPTARKGFLRLLAEHGRVSDACLCVGLSKQSAYSLRARDCQFAIGWDAACYLARMPLADRLYEQATEGLTETITREDGSTITRHRYDGRLSIAVLNRLDRRCDKAEEVGARHLGAIACWDAYVDAIGTDDPAAAQVIIDAHAAVRATSAHLSQASQPGAGDHDPCDVDDLPDPRVWWDTGRKAYRTDFPPPEGEYCDQHETYGHRDYHRSLTDAEAELHDRAYEQDALAERAADEAERDAYFAGLLEEVDNPRSSPLGEVARNDGGVGATKTPPSVKADTSPKGEEQARKTPPNPPNPEPPSPPVRSLGGARSQGEFP